MKKTGFPNITPVGLRRAAAAQYCGVSVSRFDTLVAQGEMPRAKLLGGTIKIWLRTDLEDALYSLPDVEFPKQNNPCDRLLE